MNLKIVCHGLTGLNLTSEKDFDQVLIKQKSLKLYDALLFNNIVFDRLFTFMYVLRVT